MKEEEKDYIRDIAEIRSMMERSTKFLSLSGWAGIMAGIYAFAGAYVAWEVLNFNPNSLNYNYADGGDSLVKLIILAILIMVLAVATALIDSRRKARSKGERAWNATSRRLLINMSVPLLAGGAIIIALFIAGLAGLAAPLTLVFYGLALYNAGNFTFRELRIMGLVQIVLGVLNILFIQSGLLIWVIGFGLIHIIYGIYMHIRYTR